MGRVGVFQGQNLETTRFRSAQTDGTEYEWETLEINYCNFYNNIKFQKKYVAP